MNHIAIAPIPEVVQELPLNHEEAEIEASDPKSDKTYTLPGGRAPRKASKSKTLKEKTKKAPPKREISASPLEAKSPTNQMRTLSQLSQLYGIPRDPLDHLNSYDTTNYSPSRFNTQIITKDNMLFYPYSFDSKVPFPGPINTNLLVSALPSDMTPNPAHRRKPDTSAQFSSPILKPTEIMPVAPVSKSAHNKYQEHIMSNHYSTICTKNSTDRWLTPPNIIHSVVRMVRRPIDLDPASEPSAQRIVCARQYWTKDALQREWNADVVYVNPPFGDMRGFMGHAMNQYIKGNINHLFMLTRFAPSSKWYGDAWCHPHCFTLIFSRRLKFWNAHNSIDGDVFPHKSTMPHEIGMFYFGPNGIDFDNEFRQYGRIVFPINHILAELRSDVSQDEDTKAREEKKVVRKK
ncbi:hypothetical protein BLNAU_3623 [Blattamonas nauphoetae]|uniref:Uncharacterized protein n=1 Tax=Blattamonas nauphoetae TaxID=2049346 RepID=A0ABQ9YCK2_9EUKA|nr:hypothetical protein BLNAU_3623 [Blattamonas nauphoetae]